MGHDPLPHSCCDRVQACDAHIVQSLELLKAIAVPSSLSDSQRWCLLHRGTRCDALETVLQTCVEHSMSFAAVNATVLAGHLAASADTFSCVFSHSQD